MNDRRFGWLAALLAAGAVHAEPTLYVGNVPPYAFPEGAPQRGLVYDLVRETALRAGHSGKVSVVPLRRQTALPLRQPDAMGSVTRLPEREALYSWNVRLLQERIVLVTRADRSGEIAHLDAARRLRVGVVLGGPAESVARRLGFEHIETTTNTQSNVSKLAVGRVDAIITLGGLFTAGAATQCAACPPLREGLLLEKVDVYLAGASGMEPALARQWRDAFDALRRDGGYARIMQRYGRGAEP